MTDKEVNSLSNEELIGVFENLIIAKEGHSNKIAIEIINESIPVARDNLLKRLCK